MIKFLLTSLALVFLFRVLLKLLLGGFVVRVEKHYYHNTSTQDKKQKPEGYTTIHQQNSSNKPAKYSDTEGEYVNYEEIK